MTHCIHLLEKRLTTQCKFPSSLSPNSNSTLSLTHGILSSISYSGDYREPIKLVKSGTSPFKSRTGGSPSDSSSGSGPSSGPATRKGSKPASSGESKASKEKAKTAAAEPASPTGPPPPPLSLMTTIYPLSY